MYSCYLWVSQQPWKWILGLSLFSRETGSEWSPWSPEQKSKSRALASKSMLFSQTTRFLDLAHHHVISQPVTYTWKEHKRELCGAGSDTGIQMDWPEVQQSRDGWQGRDYLKVAHNAFKYFQRDRSCALVLIHSCWVSGFRVSFKALGPGLALNTLPRENCETRGFIFTRNWRVMLFKKQSYIFSPGFLFAM